MASPRALPAPTEPIVVLRSELVQQALDVSRASDRKRVILPFHKGPEETLHRMFNAMQPGTYVRPHRHLTVPKCEVFLLLSGCLDFIVFDEHGAISFARRLEAGTAEFGIDLAAGLWHSFLVRAPDTLIYEVKPGPYAAHDDKDFAPWSPAEGTTQVAAFMTSMETNLAAYLARA